MIAVECVEFWMFLQQVAKANLGVRGLHQARQIISPLTPSSQEGLDGQGPFDEQPNADRSAFGKLTEWWAKINPEAKALLALELTWFGDRHAYEGIEFLGGGEFREKEYLQGITK